MGSKVTLEQLVQGIQFKDPRLYDLLRGIVTELKKLSADVDVLNQADLPSSLNVFPDPVLVFTYELRARSVHLAWVQPSLGVVQYEIRKGTVWDTADRITITGTLSADVDPLPTGTTRYLIKSIDSNGTYSVDAAYVDVVVHGPSGVTITTQIIDNNVLLSWTTAASDFEIDYYEVKRGVDVIGRVKATFTVVFEAQGGSYEYSITPYDIAGNAGISNLVTAEVNQPPDFELTDSYTSTLSGTLTQTVLFEDAIYACLDDAETWSDYLAAHAWSTIQDEIDAGYPYWAQPTKTTGSYVETHDFGVAYNSVIVNVDWDFNVFAGSVSVACSIEGSLDGSTWSTPASGVSAYFTSVRYIRITLSFTSGDDKGLMNLFNLRFLLDVKREVDGGTIEALAADVSGTDVTFNKTFRDIDSITLTPLSTDFCVAVYDFVDVPDPTGFSVYVFDSAGSRVDKTVSWKARGVV